MKKSWKEKIKTVLLFIVNPRLLFCFGIAWLVTNGWSYLLLGVGTLYEIDWAVAVAGAYLAFLWLPISPEKLLTFAIAILLLRWLFPKDEKTLGVLIALCDKIKNKKKSDQDPS